MSAGKGSGPGFGSNGIGEGDAISGNSSTNIAYAVIAIDDCSRKRTGADMINFKGAIVPSSTVRLPSPPPSYQRTYGEPLVDTPLSMRLCSLFATRCRFVILAKRPTRRASLRERASISGNQGCQAAYDNDYN
jgi:hypothetical protein